MKKKHLDEHSAEAIEKRLTEGVSKNYLSDFIYGSIDGTVTTFAVVSGVAGAKLAPEVIVILGVANLLADGFSMAAGCFQSIKANIQLRDKYRKMEEEHIELYPEGEKEEVKQIFANKGFEGKTLDNVVEVITSNKKLWVDTMLTEEFDLSLESENPWKAGLVTFGAFAIIGTIPLTPYLWNFFWTNGLQITNPFFWSIAFTAICFFLIGSVKGKIVGLRWWTAGFETLFVGGVAAYISYIIGAWLSKFI